MLVPTGIVNTVRKLALEFHYYIALKIGQLGSIRKRIFCTKPIIEDIDEAGLSRLAPLENLDEERASTASIDISYVLGSMETSMTIFTSAIDNVTELVAIDEMNDASGKKVAYRQYGR